MFDSSATYLDEVRRIPLTAPNVDSATNTGMIQAMKPYRRLANVCESRKNFCMLYSNAI